MKARIEQNKEEGVRLAVSSGSADSTSDDGEVRERIAVHAYELYRERGCRDGHDLDDWLEAEQAILAPEAMPESSGKGVLR